MSLYDTYTDLNARGRMMASRRAAGEADVWRMVSRASLATGARRSGPFERLAARARRAADRFLP